MAHWLSVRLEINVSLVQDSVEALCILSFCLVLVQPRKTGNCSDMSDKLTAP